MPRSCIHWSVFLVMLHYCDCIPNTKGFVELKSVVKHNAMQHCIITQTLRNNTSIAQQHKHCAIKVSVEALLSLDYVPRDFCLVEMRLSVEQG